MVYSSGQVVYDPAKDGALRSARSAFRQVKLTAAGGDGGEGADTAVGTTAADDGKGGKRGQGAKVPKTGGGYEASGDDGKDGPGGRGGDGAGDGDGNDGAGDGEDDGTDSDEGDEGDEGDDDSDGDNEEDTLSQLMPGQNRRGTQRRGKSLAIGGPQSKMTTLPGQQELPDSDADHDNLVSAINEAQKIDYAQSTKAQAAAVKKTTKKGGKDLNQEADGKSAQERLHIRSVVQKLCRVCQSDGTEIFKVMH